MIIFDGRNVNDVSFEAFRRLEQVGVAEDSRNGPVLRFPETVCSIMRKPLERVLFHTVRDANPFFHLMEAIWMLAGDNEVGWLLQFNKRMDQYADHGSIHGAYGHRWRRWWDGDEYQDQLMAAILALRQNKKTRRLVINMWDPARDLGADWKDIPCNIAMVPQVGTTGELDLIVLARSHDILWGLYGANTVHFSLVQQFLADQTGLPVGRLEFLSVNAHAYRELWHEKVAAGLRNRQGDDPYERRLVRPYAPLAPPEHTDAETFLADAEVFVSDDWQVHVYASPFWADVAIPFRRAWLCRALPDVCEDNLAQCRARDWMVAGAQYLNRHRQIEFPVIANMLVNQGLYTPTLPAGQAE